jgi:hypothetical protein
MAFFDPVDPSTESLLWPVRVGFCLVATPAMGSTLLLRLAGGPEQKRSRHPIEPATWPVLREGSTVAAASCGSFGRS